MNQAVTKRRIFQTMLMLIATGASFGQASQQRDLSALEERVAKQFNDLRAKSDIKPLKFRQDMRIRAEACSVQVKGPDPTVEFPRKFWYLTPDPNKPSDELVRMATEKTSYDHVGVGVWFATTEAYPSGMYWVVVYPEHGAAHEAFWSHFYLTDDFEYQTVFDKHWKQRLPQPCDSLS